MSTFSNFSLAALKNAADELRVQVYPKNETEKKVYEALSSKNWGASSTLMNDIAADSMDYDKYGIITGIVWQNFETDGKTWKQIFKTMTLIEFLIKNGSERFIEECRDKMYKIRRLQDYNYYEGSIDKGSGVREKAKQIIELLSSNDFIRTEREKARALRNKFIGIDSRNAGGGGGGYGGRDSYYGGSGGGGNGGGGRYGGESYSSGGNYSSNSRYGGDSYNSGTSSGGRYGGGAYDSDRPPRYGDDSSSGNRYDSNDGRGGYGNGGNYSDSGTYAPRDERHSFDDRGSSPVHKTSQRESTSTGGKLKVSIKKLDTPTKTAPAPAATASQPDLIGEDVFSAPAPAAKGSNDFGDFTASDPFAAQSTSSAPATDFDPFGAAPTQPAPAANFDPFGAAPAQPTPAAPPVPAANFDPFGAPVQPQQHSFDAFSATPQAPVQPQGMGNDFMGMNSFPVTSAPIQAPTPAQVPMMAQNVPPPAPVAPTQEEDFGGFETSTPAAPPKPDATSKWGDIGGLVNLGGIEKNEDIEAKKRAQQNASHNYANNSFAGLDGFSKTPQSMSSGRPVGGYMGNAPSQPAMMQPRGPPMGGMGGMQQPMGGMGGMQQPMGGMGGMQQPMGGMGGMGRTQQPMGGMGGMQQPMGGYPRGPGGW